MATNKLGRMNAKTQRKEFAISNRFRDESAGMRGVYIVTTFDNWPCKIGITGNMVERMIGLQVGNWHPIRPYHFVFAYRGVDEDRRMSTFNATIRAAQSFEAIMHKRLAMLVDRLAGEWFDISAEDALLAMNKIAKEEGYKLAEFEDVLKLDPKNVLFDSEKAALHDLLLVAGTAKAAILSCAT